MTDTRQEAGARFVRWLEGRVIADARGDEIDVLETKPADRLWLGRLGPESAAWRTGLGERGQRMEPCSAGFRFRPADPAPWSWRAEVHFRVWRRSDGGTWRKSEALGVMVDLSVPTAGEERYSFGASDFDLVFARERLDGYRARIDVEVTAEDSGISVAVVVVNDSEEKRGRDPNLYEVSLTAEVGELEAFVLDALPDSFRYDRRVMAYGLNGGVIYDGRVLATSDSVAQDRLRPQYWDDSLGPVPDLRFERLADDPLPPLTELVSALRQWGIREWSDERLVDRARVERWSAPMLDYARSEAGRFREELERCERGLRALSNPEVARAFRIMNEAFVHSGRDRYTAWRPFQIGFLLSCLDGLVDSASEERSLVDTLWFATGGGKTETYLGLVVFTIVYDRIRGKQFGISSWSRFPLRMLSLQQTQRFADALAGAELARRKHDLGGDPVALGFFVGSGQTPNRVRDDGPDGAVDSNDPEMPKRYRVLLYCPFCWSRELEMGFDRARWRLEHRCRNGDCPWPERGLPFLLVDEEIFRLLPSAVIGTLDKAASVSMQAAMRGLYAAPLGRCEGEGHGFTYAPRSRTKGCLVPGCGFEVGRLPQRAELFAPSLRVQDELHLLRGGLGAIDSHYETLLDHLQRRSSSGTAKIVASSATLSGYEEQAEALYGREGRVFPLPGPSEGVSFWTRDQQLLARRFVGLAPRGVTQEFANDRLAESLQRAARRLVDDGAGVCSEIGIDPANADFLLSNYGTHVVYGSKVRDVEAAVRSFETQPGVPGLNVAKLTGDTLFEDVREVLERLDSPEPSFGDRLHVICASSMMSHGVDIDRFNVITLLGMPLATAEFIQTTARIGRRFPGLAFVLCRMGIERDASVYRSFDIFVRHGDRFVEPVAITRRSRRVLEYTFPGLFMGRVLGVHEPVRVAAGERQLTTAQELRRYFQMAPVLEEDEFRELCDAVGLDAGREGDPLVEELRRLVRETFREALDPASKARFIREVTRRVPMLSLREVETQVPVFPNLAGSRRPGR